MYFDQILHIYTFFEIDRENDKEKSIKKKYWSGLDSNHCQVVGLQESLLDHSVTMCCILHSSNLPIYPLHVLVRPWHRILIILRSGGNAIKRYFLPRALAAPLFDGAEPFVQF